MKLSRLVKEGGGKKTMRQELSQALSEWGEWLEGWWITETNEEGRGWCSWVACVSKEQGFSQERRIVWKSWGQEYLPTPPPGLEDVAWKRKKQNSLPVSRSSKSLITSSFQLRQRWRERFLKSCDDLWKLANQLGFQRGVEGSGRRSGRCGGGIVSEVWWLGQKWKTSWDADDGNKQMCC